MTNDLTMRLKARADRGLAVLAASSPPSHKLKYVDQVAAAPEANMVIKFRQSGGRLNDVDIIHVIGSADKFLRLNDSSAPHERLERTRHFVELLSTREVALVRTLYGPAPVGPHPLEVEAAALLDSATTRFVTVDGATSTPNPARTVIIPYADLSERFAGYPTQGQVSGRLLCIGDEALGAVAEGVLKTFFVNRTRRLTLRLAGVVDQAINTELKQALERTPKLLTTREELLSDAALVEEITAAEFVVVPEPRTLAGYQLLMMALSFGRPVIAPENKMLLALRDEVGESWVVPLATPVTAERLDAAIAQAEQPGKNERPNLIGRGWTETGRKYARIYGDAVSEIRGIMESTTTKGRTTRIDEGRDIQSIEMRSASI